MPREAGVKSNPVPLTTAQALGSLIKSARDLMRKDKGLNGDLDRLPLLTWIMFLKFLDDLEQQREQETALSGKKFRSAVESPYRWRDWAADPQGVTGDELLAFINSDEATRPDGSRGPGLFAYLRSLTNSNGDDRREVIATVFKGVDNRMKSGYLLRDVVNKIAAIHFTSSDELHTLGALYESMLREMRDAAGDSGEFYTPRAVVRLMVDRINPLLGETVLDPASGTGGFLVEAFNHLAQQVKTIEDRKVLQEKSLFGCEPKSLPYLLCQMNLLLHGLDAPRIDSDNALRFKLSEIGEKERVDVILTNPPFGGEEEKGIQGNFPEDMQTAETALLFLQLIMRNLKRKPRGGRAAVIVPNGTLYASGVAARIRATLLAEFNLHTVVRLPKGVFEPYADIPTNILFFDHSLPTERVWFYDHPLPPHRAHLKTPSYSATDPLRFEEFEPLIEWWGNRRENEYAWEESVSVIRGNDCNLDRKNPRACNAEQIDLSALSREVADYSGVVRHKLDALVAGLQSLESTINMRSLSAITEGPLGQFCDVIKGAYPTMKTGPGQYTFVVTAADSRTADSYQLEGEAVCIPMVSSTGHGHAAIHRLHFATGKFAVANIMAAVLVRAGVPLLPKYLYYYLWRYKDEKLVSLMAGTANTSLTIEKLRSVTIAFPDIESQEELVRHLDAALGPAAEVIEVMGALADLRERSVAGALRASFN